MPVEAPDTADAATAAPTISSEHESAVRRWLTMVVERSSLAELSERPLGARMSDARLLLEALEPNREEESPDVAAPDGGLRSRIDALLETHRRTGEPFAVALVATAGDTPTRNGPRPLDEALPTVRRFGRQVRSLEPANERWAMALQDAAGEGELVLAAGHGTAVVLPGTSAGDARAAVDRLRVSAWRLIGEEGRLAEAGLACCPEDGTSAHDLLAAAEERLDHAAGRRGDPYGEPAEAPEALREATALRVLPLR